MRQILLLFLLFSSTVLVAQVNPWEYQEEKPPLLKNEWTIGLNIHTAGWGGNFRRGKNITAYKKRLYEFEVFNIKHPKEVRTVNPYFDNAKSFFYGKQNTLTVVRLGFGKQKILFSKAEKGGVEVRLNYTGGFSLGLAKPVYLNILYPTKFEREYELRVEKYDPERHYVDNIYGRASFMEGIGEIKPYPGGYGKLGFAFEYGKWSESIKCIEVGAMVDVYAKEIPIMAKTENSQVYLNFYINLLYGRKW